MNFKPVDRKNSPNSIQKLQDIDYPIIGNFAETTTSKMGSLIYHIRRDYDLVRIYGFKNLDEQMVCVHPNQLIRITYQGSKNTSSGGIMHFALVEVSEKIEFDVEQVVEQETAKEPSTLHIPCSIDYPAVSKIQPNILEKLGIIKK